MPLTNSSQVKQLKKYLARLWDVLIAVHFWHLFRKTNNKLKTLLNRETSDSVKPDSLICLSAQRFENHLRAFLSSQLMTNYCVLHLSSL